MPTAVAKTSVAEEPSPNVELLRKDSPPEERLSAPENFINRELSWLEFNRRVLEEAQDPTQPLIERVKFLTIFSSNLDEFFEIRVAGIKQQIKSETSDIGPDGLSPTDTFDRIQKTVRRLVATQCALWKNELLPELAKNGIYVREMAELTPKRAAWAHRYFQQEVLPMLTPLAVDASHPFPHLLNRSHNLLVQANLQRGDGPLTMTHLMPLVTNDAFAKLKDRPFQPARDPALPPHVDFFEVLRRQDVLLHHPYDSFDQIVEWIEAAACDSQVLAIKITLYRTSGDSPIVEALIEAANAGKQITAIVELRARFDEASNIRCARRLEEAGAHVIYGVVGLKTHCKALLIVRRDADQLRRYVHLGTGNYHSRTARIYTDFSLLTSEAKLTEEVATVFNTLTGLAGYPGLKKLMVAPFDMHSRLIRLIERERDHARGGKPARIVAKLNALVDQEIIEKLYEASCADVTIDLIVRGICCLRPKMPGLSDNIRVISIVGRFLEHSRIFYFENAGQPRVFLSSADWMPRNFYRRIELAFPVENPAFRDQIINEALPRFLLDRLTATEVQPDGKYRRLKPEGSEPRAQAQWHFREVSRERAKKMSGSKKKLRAAKLTPITVASENLVTTNPETESAQKSARTAIPESASSTSANTSKKS